MKKIKDFKVYLSFLVMSNQIREICGLKSATGLILQINCFTYVSGYRIKSMIQSICYGI